MLLVTAAMASASSCITGKKCPSDKPCCSVDGKCGRGAEQCGGGCYPPKSASPFSCLSLPLCKNMDVPLPPSSYNDSHVFRPLLTYTGDANTAPFTFDSGYLGKGSEGVLLQMTRQQQSTVATSTYMLYGNVSATLRRPPSPGIVSTFGLRSSVGDVIEFQFGGSNGAQFDTVYYALNHQGKDSRKTNKMKNFSFGDFHTYSIVWNPNALHFKCDDKTVHTVVRKVARDNYPRSPARIVLRSFSAEKNRQYAKLAGGKPSWNSAAYRDKGFYAQELKHLKVQCPQLSWTKANITGVGHAPQAFYYTGRNSSQIGEPEFQITRDQVHTLSDPARDGDSNLPGAPGQDPNGPKSNMWTGGSSASSGTGTGTSTGSGQGSYTGHGDSGGMSTAKRLAIGIPVGVGGAIVLALLAALAFCLLGRSQRDKRRSTGSAQAPPASMPPPTVSEQTYAPPAQSQPSMYQGHSAVSLPVTTQTYEQPSEALAAPPSTVPAAIGSHQNDSLDSYASEKRAAEDEHGYYHQVEPYDGVSSQDRELHYDEDEEDEESYSSHAPHEHYARHKRGAYSTGDEYMSPSELRNYLREEALGGDTSEFFQSRQVRDRPAHTAYKVPSGGRKRKTYSQGGALGSPVIGGNTLNGGDNTSSDDYGPWRRTAVPY